MTDRHDDEMLAGAFESFWGEVAPHVSAAGTGAAHATVRRWRWVRVTVALALAALAVAAPVTAYATISGDPHGPPVRLGQPQNIAPVLGGSGASASATDPAPDATGTPDQAPATATGDSSAHPTSGAAGTPSSGAPARCRTAQLSAELDLFDWPGQIGAEAEGEIGLTNTGSRSCVITGYIGARLIDADGQEAPTTLVREDTPPPASLVLAPGRTAWALISWWFTPSGGEQYTSPLCGGKMFGLWVTAPGESTSIRLGGQIGTVCWHHQLFVSPVTLDRPSRSRALAP
jgi:hypothetical protein